MRRSRRSTTCSTRGGTSGRWTATPPGAPTTRSPITSCSAPPPPGASRATSPLPAGAPLWPETAAEPVAAARKLASAGPLQAHSVSRRAAVRWWAARPFRGGRAAVSGVGSAVCSTCGDRGAVVGAALSAAWWSPRWLAVRPCGGTVRSAGVAVSNAGAGRSAGGPGHRCEPEPDAVAEGGQQDRPPRCRTPQARTPRTGLSTSDGVGQTGWAGSERRQVDQGGEATRRGRPDGRGGAAPGTVAARESAGVAYRSFVSLARARWIARTAWGCSGTGAFRP